jgi:uncharacterized protein (DUF2141 family)
MKKTAIATLVALSAAAYAADYVTVDIDHVKSKQGYADSTAQYVRAGKEVGGIQLGLQSRTSVSSNGGMYNSLETTAGKSIGGFTPFVGVGFDNGANGAKNSDYRYSLIGATTGLPVGPGYALVGAKTRVSSTEANMTHQTVAFGTYSVPVAKGVAVNFNLSKSYQDIKENAYGLGVGFSF